MAGKKAKGNRVQVILECTEENRRYPPRRLKGWSRLHKGYQDGKEPQDWCLHL